MGHDLLRAGTAPASQQSKQRHTHPANADIKHYYFSLLGIQTSAWQTENFWANSDVCALKKITNTFCKHICRKAEQIRDTRKEKKYANSFIEIPNNSLIQLNKRKSSQVAFFHSCVFSLKDVKIYMKWIPTCERRSSWTDSGRRGQRSSLAIKPQITAREKSRSIQVVCLQLFGDHVAQLLF